MHLAFSERGTEQLPPLVLLHAFPLNRHMWKQQLQGLSERLRVIAPDMPGFGQSPILKEPPALAAYAQAVIDLLDQKHIKKAVFGGCSMGGYVLFQILKDFPERISGFVLCDTKAEADTEEARQNRFASIKAIQQHGLKPLAETMVPKLISPATQAANPDFAVTLKDAVLGNFAEGICHAQEAMANRGDFSGLAKHIAFPALIINGKDDPFTPPEIGRILQSLIPGSALKIIENAGHLAPAEQPAAVNEAILQFLQEHKILREVD